MNYEVITCRRCKSRYLGDRCPVCYSNDVEEKGVDKFDNDYTDLGLE